MAGGTVTQPVPTPMEAILNFYVKGNTVSKACKTSEEWEILPNDKYRRSPKTTNVSNFALNLLVLNAVTKGMFNANLKAFAGFGDVRVRQQLGIDHI